MLLEQKQKSDSKKTWMKTLKWELYSEKHSLATTKVAINQKKDTLGYFWKKNPSLDSVRKLAIVIIYRVGTKDNNIMFQTHVIQQKLGSRESSYLEILLLFS